MSVYLLSLSYILCFLCFLLLFWGPLSRPSNQAEAGPTVTRPQPINLACSRKPAFHSLRVAFSLLHAQLMTTSSLHVHEQRLQASFHHAWDSPTHGPSSCSSFLLHGPVTSIPICFRPATCMARHAWRLFLQQRDFRNEDTPAMATFSAKVFRLQKSRTIPTCLVRQLKATCFCQFCSSFTHHLSWLATRDLHHPANCYLPCTPSQLTTCLLASYSPLCVCQSLISRKGAMLHDPKS